MPVTAKLSQAFYDRLGNDVANELVEWFNSVDATYRLDLRHLNELNFSRFDSKLEQRLAQFEAKLEQRLVQVEGRIEGLEVRLIARLEMRLAEVRTEMLRWMVASWSTMMVVLLGTLFAVLRSS